MSFNHGNHTNLPPSFQTMMSNGDYYSGGSLYINGSVSDNAGSDQIETTLTLDEVGEILISDWLHVT